MNEKPWGLGKPTTGEYDTTGSLGYHVFGGQGQGELQEGWKLSSDSTCAHRYMMVLVQSADTNWPDQQLEIEFKSVPFAQTPSPLIKLANGASRNESFLLLYVLLYVGLYWFK